MTDYPNTSDTRTTADPAVELNTRGNPMLLEETLARSRMRDAEAFARQHRQHRQARRASTAARWRRLATWADRRALNTA
ncbi:hypothetical protein KCV87_15945 [Actinosynnema pretiosum subsp. pretiosum]|uniref:Uncharacterized protein n=2 Tax=Actinosynnema TaxID=40566 RepID=C6WNH1_ACTMD|nr:hypothetical protein [Actinosynnema mirum]ACU34890.1 hypothetical protein Amir_0930 [Actinosynnema mirum DSM 43827]AXX28250.1 hypothetical protein APASM_0885 [Actinosynnema pretiosum subsp. pretiosum]QUF07381.1 hypothetical protein KCV87_15945 [Actinosynnema pretiosum subsp. pretiosum]